MVIVRTVVNILFLLAVQLLLRGVFEVHPTQLIMEAKVYIFQATKVHLGSEYMSTCVFFAPLANLMGFFCGRKDLSTIQLSLKNGPDCFWTLFVLCGDWRVFGKGKYDRDKFGSLGIWCPQPMVFCFFGCIIRRSSVHKELFLEGNVVGVKLISHVLIMK